MNIKITAIDYYLPSNQETNSDLLLANPDWDIPKIYEKTGIESRFISLDGQSALDLAYAAASGLLSKIPIKDEIDLLIFVTQSAENPLPSGSCILQDRLGLSKKCMAFDINLGCSGFVYALSVASSLMENNVAYKALVVCADTYSKYIREDDRTCRPIFSDGASATLLDKTDSKNILSFDFGTDGSGSNALMVKKESYKYEGESCVGSHLEMLGSEVFLFTMKVVPVCIENALIKAGLTMDDINLVIFHQASKLVLENLARVMKLDQSKVYNNIKNIGNTVSSSIPIALKNAQDDGRLNEGDKVLLVGFGVGFSWGSTILVWEG